MGCGDKYKYLVVTSSGYTPEKPGLMLPFWSSDEVYSDWYELARKLANDANGRLNSLGEIECQKTGGTKCGTADAAGGSYPKWNELITLNNRMWKNFDALPSPTLVIDRGSARTEAQAVIADALCLMEQADDGIVAYGGKIPKTPGSIGTPNDKMPPWVWGVIGAGAALVVLGVVFSRRKKHSEPPLPQSLTKPKDSQRAVATRPQGAVA